MDFLQKLNTENKQQLSNEMNIIAQKKALINQGAIESQARERIKEEQEKNQRLNNDANFYKSLLSRPMAEIARYNKDFAMAYEIQQQEMSDWILSQKAFKELALDLGANMGMSEDDVESEYTVRVHQIASGDHPGEKIPEKYKDYAGNSAQYLITDALKKRNNNQ